MNRLTRAILILAGLGGLMYVLVSLFLPSPRRMIFGVDKRSGAVRMAEQGITFLPPDRFYRLSFERRNGWAQRDGIVNIRSREGVPLKVTYRLRFGVEKDRLPDAQRLVSEGWSAWIRARVGEAVSAVTQHVAVDELASPSSQFARQREQLREAVARHLARSGLKVTGFAIMRIDVDREALLNYKRAELRRTARGAAGRVAIFTIEGADWELLSELIVDDRMPNLQGMIRSGASASLQSIQPTISPMVWTTVTTGLAPDRHGVFSFFDAKGQPVSGLSRRGPAVWEIADAFGRDSVIVSTWGAWPPTISGSVFDVPVDLQQTAVTPAALSQRVASQMIPESTIGYPQIRRFLNITAAEYEKAINEGGPQDPVVMFRSVLAKTWSDHRAAIELYKHQDPAFLMVGYDGTDAVNHLFAPYHPPYREGMPTVPFRKYWPTVANYYSEVDRLLGEWLRILPDDTTIMVVSGYGSRWGRSRPWRPPAGNSTLQSHRATGALVLFGNGVAPSLARRQATVFEIAPTVLSLLGLPPSREMPGEAMTWAFRNLTPVTGLSITSYSDLMLGRPGAELKTDPAVYRARLEAVGHVINPERARLAAVAEDEEQADEPEQANVTPAVWGQYAYFNNLGVQLRAKGDRKGAGEAFSKAIELNGSRPTPYLNLAMMLFEQQRFTNAEELFLEAVKRGLPNAERYFVDFAAVYRAQDMPTRAANLLMKGKALYPGSHVIAANLGSALADSKRYTEGVMELERALGIQPASTLALNNLGVIHMRRQEYGRALDYWNRSLAIDPTQPQIRQAVTAVQSRL